MKIQSEHDQNGPKSKAELCISPSHSIAKGSHQEALGLHFVMFLPTLYSQCDPQQSRKWLPLAESFRVVGTYAQTEMGHGQSAT